MPPAFPMGGMSNPMLSYTSQTTIVGDKSQEYVLVRNLAQSWTGNQVTPSNWEDYWLNEGFTTFVERHVLAQLYDYNFAATEAYVGNNTLATETQIIGLPDKTYVSLHPVLHGDNPDNAFNTAPFEKGFQFLQWIEDFVLGYYHMEDFLEYYLVMNSLMSIDEFTMRKTFSNFIETYYPDANHDNDLLQSIQFTQWIYEVGPDPTGLLDFTNPYTTAAKSLALAYISGGGSSSPSNYQDYNEFFSNQRVVFLQTLLQNINTDEAIITRIDADLDITSATDPEVRQRWYAIGLYLNYAPVYTPAETWVGQMGRNKYINSIYEALSESGQVALGTTWYNNNKWFYCPITQQLIEKILGL